MTTLTIHPELHALIPPLSTEEYRQLEANILAEGCREPFIVWPQALEDILCHQCERGNFVCTEQGVQCSFCGVDLDTPQRGSFGEPDFTWDPQVIILEAILIDGHHRHDICEKHDVPHRIVPQWFPDLDAAKTWMLQQQLGRRNLTPEQISYLRGKEYAFQKQIQGTQNQYVQAKREKGHNDSFHKEPTKQILAEKHKVAAKTIQRDAAYAAHVDTITDAVPDAKQTILARDTKVGRQEVKQLATIAAKSPQTAKHVVEEVQAAPTPKAAKRVVRAAIKELSPPEPKSHTPTKTPRRARQETPRQPQRTFEVQEAEPRRGLETLLSTDKREMFIVHNPDSTPVFNKTNDMVDWASWTWNPVTGCWHGCDYCYARGIANQTDMQESYPKQFEPTFHPARLHAPANTSVPKMLTRPADRNVFTCSMADLFGRWVPDDWIMQVFERVTLHPEWNFLFLTKFPQRLQAICDALDGFPDNAWVGCTVDAQARVTTAERAFANIRARVRWLSVEPMRERLTFSNLGMFDWLVMGGQSASAYNKTPAFQPEWEWVEHLWQQARTAGIKVYWKENLTVRPKEVPWSEDTPWTS